MYKWYTSWKKIVYKFLFLCVLIYKMISSKIIKILHKFSNKSSWYGRNLVFRCCLTLLIYIFKFLNVYTSTIPKFSTSDFHSWVTNICIMYVSADMIIRSSCVNFMYFTKDCKIVIEDFRQFPMEVIVDKCKGVYFCYIWYLQYI